MNKGAMIRLTPKKGGGCGKRKVKETDIFEKIGKYILQFEQIHVEICNRNISKFG